MIDRCVIKIGGSLLARRETPSCIARLLREDYAGRQVSLLIGGGKVVDALRDLDAVHRLSPVEMHWRCIRALRLTFEIGCEWFPDVTRVSTAADFQTLRGCTAAGTYLIAADAFYAASHGDALPQNWSTTSDSIAALLAHRLSAARLVLLKSCEIPQGLTVEQAAQVGIVDPSLPAAGRGLRIELRSVLAFGR